LKPAGIELPLLPDSVPLIPVFDRAGLVDHLGGEELVDVFVNKFLSGMLVQLDKLQAELDCGSVDKVRAVAHAIKGLAANIGAEQVRQMALDMETAAGVGDLAGVATLQGCMLEVYEAFERETVGDKS
jgi:HPt (histidine-containing phosphotransfer) domain-containing protein